MAAPRKGPDKLRLKQYLAEGMTQQEIVDAWKEETGLELRRTTISMAMQKHGLKAVYAKPRHDDVIPWKVHVEHLMHYDARMLRLYGRRKKGLSLVEEDRHRLEAWIEMLDASKAVVTYHPDTTDGFHWTPRKAEDGDGYVRMPKTARVHRQEPDEAPA